MLGPENRALASAVERLLLDHAAQGLLVVGGPRSGKTALVQAVRQAARSLGWQPERSTPGVLRHPEFAAEPLLLWDDLDHVLGPGKRDGEQLARLLDQCPRALLTTTRPPRQFKASPGVLDRLQRLAVLELQDPGLATRQLLLRRFASRHEVPLSEKHAQRLARQWALPAGALEERLLDLVRGFVPQLPAAPASGTPGPGTPRRQVLHVARVTARFYRLPLDQLRGNLRQRRVVHARRMAMFLSRRHLPVTLEQIGEVFGGKDHTTVLYHCRQIRRLLQRDARIRSELRQLERLLGFSQPCNLAAG